MFLTEAIEHGKKNYLTRFLHQESCAIIQIMWCVIVCLLLNAVIANYDMPLLARLIIVFCEMVIVYAYYKHSKPE